uniref:Uncharacterized protein n=1 Tax=Pyxicephalus adspersus TaxID=30357 RepID=A0AAV3B1K7_PYXAD|nr:TPA: hypothetical protein GDO54_000992 [Pyxicephalus adspersus]
MRNFDLSNIFCLEYNPPTALLYVGFFKKPSCCFTSDSPINPGSKIQYKIYHDILCFVYYLSKGGGWCFGLGDWGSLKSAE